MKKLTSVQDAIKHQGTYLSRHPWAKHLSYARDRVNRASSYKNRGIKVLLTMAEIEELWEVCEADRLNRPSLDRIDGKGNYTFKNCRFIELDQNHNNRRVEMVKDGVVVAVFDSMKQAERMGYGFASNIWKVIKGHYKQTNGYQWKLAK